MSRQVVTCENCDLVQFLTEKAMCRRCRKPLIAVEEPEEESKAPEPIQQAEQVMDAREAWAFLVSKRIFQLRRKRGMSQRQLAEKLDCPRTWISKLERQGACLNIVTLERLAIVFRVPISDLLITKQEADCWELFADPFLAELIAEGKGLKPKAWAAIEREAMKMAQKRRGDHAPTLREVRTAVR